ncbi:MAG: glycosyltransferase family 4 protein [Kiritimatiellae bacterium]|nr:glycosyltransferase family 4 protein [Kiritimatiellia bacterium]
MKKRVLLITSMPYFQWRGSPIRIRFDLQALAESGYEVDLITLPIGEDLLVEGTTIHRVGNPLGITSISIGPSLTKLFFDVLLLWRALSFSAKNKVDVVHGFEETGAVAWLVGRIRGARVVFEKHSDPGSYKQNLLKNLVLWAYRQVETFTIRHADAVIGTGEALCEQAREVAPGKPVHHIFDIPSSLTEPDQARADLLAQTYRKHPDEVLALYVGSFASYQGIDLMFDSMPYVLKKHPQVRFLIVGGSPEEIAGRTDWLTRHGIAGQVSFLGKLPPDELPHTLAAADILLSPRQHGVNTPLKLLDYLKAARPIVATDTPANRRILDDSFAMLVEGTAPAFAAGINTLVGEEDLRLRFGVTGRERIDTRYNFAEFKRRLAACYAEVLS